MRNHYAISIHRAQSKIKAEIRNENIYHKRGQNFIFLYTVENSLFPYLGSFLSVFNKDDKEMCS